MNRRISLIALAVVLAVGGTVAVYSYAHNADKRAVAATRSISVLYAQKQIPKGTSWHDAVAAGYFAQERVPEDAAPSTALASTQAAVPSDQVATADIASGQIVVRPMFGAKTSTTGILQIPAKDIAVSVKLPANADVAGFVQSGSQVAIYSTFQVSKPSSATPNGVYGGGTDVYATKLLLPRVDVLATSQDAPSALNGDKSANNSTNNVLVTLALSQQDAEKLILAQQIGQLYLGLLSSSSVTAPDAGVYNVVTFKPAPIFVK